jgi:NAD(P)-dependent dehydrogenase (short-subunit alcohol dehydrogenase family)
VRKKIALITGASRGIGRDIALALAAPFDVVVNYARHEADAAAVVAEAAGGTAADSMSSRTMPGSVSVSTPSPTSTMTPGDVRSPSISTAPSSACARPFLDCAPAAGAAS